MCPECQGPTRVIDSRKHPTASIVWRRRECRRCGARFETYEGALDCLDKRSLAKLRPYEGQGRAKEAV